MQVAIHQPNFFPWAGYFDKIRRAQHFIFLDDVQYPKTGGSWSNRVKILQGHDGAWLTAPVERKYQGLRTIQQMCFAATDWRQDVLRALEGAYRKAPYFVEAMQLLQPLVMHEENNIASYNIHAVTTLCQHFGLATPCTRSSEYTITSTATERLIALTNAVGGTRYLCGGGADGYQQDEAFAAAGIGLDYQHFTPWPYPQRGGEFVAGLSIIDALMHIGIDATASRIQEIP